MAREITRERALDAAWKRGLLKYKLKPYQHVLHDKLWELILDPECNIGVPVISRQWGKSFNLNLVAVEFAIRVPGAQIRMAAPNRLELKNITQPIMNQIFADCPEKYKPRWRDKDHKWVFPNGSEIHLGGANDGHADDLRGPRAHLGIVDEAGFVDDIEYLVDSIMIPQTLTTGGTVLVTSTPPISPAHGFREIARAAMLLGHYIHRDIYSTDFPRSRIEAIKQRCGGDESSTWKREYLALFVVDQLLAIVREWNSEKYSKILEPTGLSGYWHRYESMDMGVRDNTAVLFAQYLFNTAKIYVEDEFIAKGSNLITPNLADGIRVKEKTLGYDKTGVYRRVADNNNLQLINDLRAIHSLPFIPTSKDELPAMVNELRTWVSGGRVVVHPRCTNLLECLSSGVWKNEANVGREMARVKHLGHFDALAALIYLVRNIDVMSNPIPPGLGFDPYSQWISPRVLEQESDVAAAIRNIYRMGRK